MVETQPSKTCVFITCITHARLRAWRNVTAYAVVACIVTRIAYLSLLHAVAWLFLKHDCCVYVFVLNKLCS